MSHNSAFFQRTILLFISKTLLTIRCLELNGVITFDCRKRWENKAEEIKQKRSLGFGETCKLNVAHPLDRQRCYTLRQKGGELIQFNKVTLGKSTF